jgi:penicillin-binding protein 2
LNFHEEKNQKSQIQNPNYLYILFKTRSLLICFMPVFNQSRSYIIKAIFLSLFLVIIIQLIYLQFFGNKYNQLAMNNAISEKIIYPERGIIYDRNGKTLLNNIIMFDLMVTPSEAKGIDTIAFCRLMQLDTADFKKRMIDAVFKNTSVRPSVFMSLLPPELQARFEENSWRFPGFSLIERPVRRYPYNIGAHFLGYIGEVSPADIERSEGFYRMGDYIGKNGLEYSYERVLMGQRGVQFMIKDNKNRIVGSFKNGAFDTTAVAGRSLKTFVDVDLQSLAEKLMQHKVGAAVAIDPKTGGILAMASGPVFNPNDLSGSEKNANFGKMVLDVTAPLLNRAIKGMFEPGSTFKPLGGLVALDENVITPAFGYPCAGRYNACGHGKPACTHAGAGHAANLRLAIANSCNSYFAHVYRLTVDNPRIGGVRKGFDKWAEYMHKFGLGVKLGVDLPSEDKGNIPTEADYDKENNGQWTSCTNLTLGIGQDKMLATPLQLANAMCIIANKGYYYIPHFVDSLEDEKPEDTPLLAKYRERHNVLTNISDTAYNAIINGMQDVVTHGTAASVRIDGINVCAKTGTAENYIKLPGRSREKLKNHSVFVCFAPKENPRIAVAVVIANGGFGATSAGPIAKLIMEKYLLDSLSKKAETEIEIFAEKNLMPSYYPRLQYITDSSRAEEWAKKYGDSTKLKKFLKNYKKPQSTSSVHNIVQNKKNMLNDNDTKNTTDHNIVIRQCQYDAVVQNDMLKYIQKYFLRPTKNEEEDV